MEIEEPEFKHLGGSVWEQIYEIAGDLTKESPDVFRCIEQARDSWDSEESYTSFKSSGRNNILRFSPISIR